MTEYTILVIADSMNPPVTYQEGGTVKADDKKEAVEKFMSSHTLESLEREYSFSGQGNIIDVLAVPNSYVAQYSMNYGSGSIKVEKQSE